MIPITFMDGATVFEWNKFVWAALFGLATFLFWHLLLNQNDAYLDALRQTRVAIALGLVLIYGEVTLATWLIFNPRRSPRRVIGRLTRRRASGRPAPLRSPRWHRPRP